MPRSWTDLPPQIPTSPSQPSSGLSTNGASHIQRLYCTQFFLPVGKAAPCKSNPPQARRVKINAWWKVPHGKPIGSLGNVFNHSRLWRLPGPVCLPRAPGCRRQEGAGVQEWCVLGGIEAWPQGLGEWSGVRGRLGATDVGSPSTPTPPVGCLG